MAKIRRQAGAEPSKRELMAVSPGSGRKPHVMPKEVSDALMDLFLSARGPREHDDIIYGHVLHQQQPFYHR